MRSSSVRSLSSSSRNGMPVEAARRTVRMASKLTRASSMIARRTGRSAGDTNPGGSGSSSEGAAAARDAGAACVRLLGGSVALSTAGRALPALSSLWVDAWSTWSRVTCAPASVALRHSRVPGNRSGEAAATTESLTRQAARDRAERVATTERRSSHDGRGMLPNAMRRERSDASKRTPASDASSAPDLKRAKKVSGNTTDEVLAFSPSNTSHSRATSPASAITSNAGRATLVACSASHSESSHGATSMASSASSDSRSEPAEGPWPAAAALALGTKPPMAQSSHLACAERRRVPAVDACECCRPISGGPGMLASGRACPAGSDLGTVSPTESASARIGPRSNLSAPHAKSAASSAAGAVAARTASNSTVLCCQCMPLSRSSCASRSTAGRGASLALAPES
mmetsp:Transcript_4175/g.17600  ORF Transcript_4175/g.17600 Transcript_4175/m.17600 type:complete len:401 (+) Transcript_4175:1905-3107(+)